MPNWLINQMKKAYYEKNVYQIKLLNQCWYFYRKSIAHNSTALKEQTNFFQNFWLIDRCLLPSACNIRLIKKSAVDFADSRDFCCYLFNHC
ncbi:cortex morphogenetic protein CmpA [Aeribacillus pallidus]|nr:cortex morphogenetic protein CmpA [Aeribacillus pallidus]